MKKKRAVVLLTVFVELMMFVMPIVNVYASELTDECELSELPELQDYVAVIDEVNEYYGCTISLPTNEQILIEGSDRNELISNILEMDCDVFREYLISELEEVNEILSISVPLTDDNELIQTLDMTKTQRAYIGGIGYVEIVTDVYYAGMAYRYNYLIDKGSGYTTNLTKDYYFVATSFDYSFKNNSTECHTTFGGYLKKMNGLILVSSMVYKPIFYAAGGDINLIE